MSGADYQDHSTVVIGNKNARGPGGSNGRANQGDKKQVGVIGIGGKLSGQTAAKLDDNEVKAPDTVGKDIGKAIAAARTSLEWTQKDLADKLAVTKTVILQLEQGTHKKDNKLIQKVENKLGVWLTGDSSRIGTEKTASRGAKSKTKAAEAWNKADKMSTSKNEDGKMDSEVQDGAGTSESDAGTEAVKESTT